MMEFYALGQDHVTYETWADGLPKEFTGLGDIFFYDPVYFLRHMAQNAFRHFISDMKELVGWRLGIFAVLGLILLWVAKADKRKVIYFSFGIIYFLILTLVFYNSRFSLYLLAFYIPLAVWPFTSPGISVRLRRFSWVSTAILVFLLLTYSFTTTKATLAEIKHTPPALEDLKDLGLALGKTEPDKSKKIIARKPHVAYFAGLEALMFPEKIRNIEDLVGFCHENGIDYVLYSGIEAGSRPYLRVLLNVNQKHSGLERVYHNRFGVIYRVTGLHDR